MILKLEIYKLCFNSFTEKCYNKQGNIQCPSQKFALRKDGATRYFKIILMFPARPLSDYQ